MTVDRETRRWWVAAFVALFGGATGVVTGRSLPLLVGVVGVVFATYARVGSPPDPTLALERALSDPEPSPGDAVRVTVTVRNEGGSLADLRLVDGVPRALETVGGSPRHATALAPGDEASFSYTVLAERGQHRFEPMLVLARDPSGAVERESEIASETILSCQPPLTDVPLRSQTTQYTGQIATDTGGSGLEFHATREYRHGDPLSRIDWNRRARTGELTTVEFREERAAAVMLAIDSRAAAYFIPGPGQRHAVAHAVAAAGRVFAHLLDGGDRVGITTLGPEPCWLAPGAGTDHEHRARMLLASHPALSYEPPDDGLPELAIDPDHDPVDVGPLRRRLSTDTQVILFSPLCDDAVAVAARELAARGRAVTVVSPDVTDDDSSGHRLARIQRANRMHQLRSADVRVVDWPVEASFTAALARAEAMR